MPTDQYHEPPVELSAEGDIVERAEQAEDEVES